MVVEYTVRQFCILYLLCDSYLHNPNDITLRKESVLPIMLPEPVHRVLE